MRKLSKVVLLVILLILSLSNVVYADSNELYSVDIEVFLDEYGNGKVTEIWTLSYPEGTENYILKGNLGNVLLKNFTVMTNDYGLFEEQTPWEVNKSREQKTHKYGLVSKGNDYELCWGIGDSNSATSYIIQYTLDGMVERYTNGTTGFNWQFIAEEMKPAPQNVTVRIHRVGGFDLDKTNIWGFGFGGYVGIEEGVILAESLTPLSSNDYLTILMETPDYYFNTFNESPYSFEETEQTALEKSDYDNDFESVSLEDLELGEIVGLGFYFISIMLFTFLMPVIMFGGFVFLLFLGVKASRIKNLPSRNADVPYYRDLPFNGDIPLSFYAITEITTSFPKYENLISAYLFKWVNDGYFEVIDSNSDLRLRRLIGKGEESGIIALELVNGNMTTSTSMFERELFMVILRAVGDDRILEAKSFNAWAKKNYMYLNGVLDNCLKDAEKELIKRGYIIKERLKFIEQKEMTSSGVHEIHKLLGFRKYLLAYSNPENQRYRDLSKHDDYMIWATLFDDADKIEEQFGIVIPTYNSSHNNRHRNFRRALRKIGKSGSEGMRSSSSGRSSSGGRSSGGGGRSSRSGGGGSRGGGRGGGSR